MSELRVLMITAEYAPLAKVGGLADMSAGLAHWLAGRGHHIGVLMPAYGEARLPAHGAHVAADGRLEWALSARDDGPVRVWRLVCPALFGTADVYRGDARDAERFALLGEAACTLVADGTFQPDVVHAHDWHAAGAVVPGPAGARPAAATVLTIHNIGYQGVFATADLGDTPLAAWSDALATDAADRETLNFLRAGIASADALTTVSPTHAREILTPELGMGLDGLLNRRADVLHGILNGADYRLWSPETDTLIAAPFGRDDPTGKRRNRDVLCETLGLDPDPAVPLVCMVTRLTEHKGLDLVVQALPALFARHAFRCAILGQGDRRYVQALEALAADHPGRLLLRLGYDETLSHRLIAGADVLLMPSRYEPCGLTQLYAMRYGTVPVVRATGGLADSVQPFDAGSGTGTGVVFRDYDVPGLSWGVGQALDWYGQPALWRRLVANAMAEDFSWQRQGPHYERLYRDLLRAR